MSSIAAELLVPGFDDPVHDAQRVFRCVLDALAYPGRIVDLAHGPDGPAYGGLAGLPDSVPRSLAAVLLALTDADAPVCLLPADAPALAALLRFHAGTPILAQPEGAAFAAVLDPEFALPLDQFDRGTPDYPDRSTTVLVVLPALEGGPAVQLRGPGIAETVRIAPQGLPAAFWRERAALQIDFPLGVDLILCAGNRLLALARTTQARLEEH